MIKEERGYLGSHLQHFTFQQDDCDPFWMTERMKAEKKEDKVIKKAKKVKNSGKQS